MQVVYLWVYINGYAVRDRFPRNLTVSQHMEGLDWMSIANKGPHISQHPVLSLHSIAVTKNVNLL